MVSNNFPGIGTKGGMDYNFFQKKDITATAFGADTISGTQPDMVIRFQTSSIMLLNEGTGVIEYSFNGAAVHGELDSTKPSAGITFDNRIVSRIWFRVKSGSTGPISVSVYAW